MDAKEAMQIGMDIAEKHAAHVKEFTTFPDVDVDKALHGNLVWLATQIMTAIQGNYNPRS